MKFAAFLPYIPPDQVIPAAIAAEQAGWDTAGVVDSVFYPEKVSADYPHVEGGERFWTHETPFVDPFVAIPAMAAVTSRLTFFVGVLKAPIRQPLLVAKTVGSAEAMFPGRIALGVGTSWIPEEFKWLSEDWASRGARLDEMIAIIRLCLSPGWAEFHGKHYDFDRLTMAPLPPAPLPIYVGGHAPPALRRAARLGDGWISVNAEFDQLRSSLDTIRAERAAQGRDGPFEVVAVCYEQPSVDDVRRYEEVGVTMLAVTPYALDDDTAERKCDGIRRYADAVIAKVGGAAAPVS